MCAGRFVNPEDIEGGEAGSTSSTQVALGSDSGAIYILNNLEVHTYEF